MPSQPDVDRVAQELGSSCRVVDAEQAVTVWAGARAAAAGLDAEQVVEQRHDEVVVQVPAAVADHERHDAQPPRVVVAEDLDLGPPRTSARPPLDERVLEGADRVGADGLLELEHEPGADRLDDGRGARPLRGARGRRVHVLAAAHVGDGAAAGDGGHRFWSSRA
jgi:hypothetical protein